jgi:hypothetical protein
MGNFKPGNPGCSCCDPACEELCFHVLGCGHDFEGVEIEVFETGVPGTILDSGFTDANGDVCFDMSAHAGDSLSYRAIPPDLTDFAELTNVLIGNWCGRTVEVNMPPATIAGVPAEGGGTVNVLFTKCNGSSPWATATTELKVLFDVEDTATTGSDGRAVLEGVADGSSAYYVRAYRPTDGTAFNSPTFILDPGECADVHIRLTDNDSLPCNPDTECTITIRTCEPGSDAIAKQCCEDCFPDTVSSALEVSDPEGVIFDGTGASLCDFTLDEFVASGGRFSTGWGAVRSLFLYSITCSGAGVTLRKSFPAFSWTCTITGTDPYGLPYTCYLRETGTGAAPGYDSGEITATSIVCDPFSATFDLPAKTWTYYRIIAGSYDLAHPCGTMTLPAHTITVIE